VRQAWSQHSASRVFRFVRAHLRGRRNLDMVLRSRGAIRWPFMPSFSELNLHPALAQAITARGYAEALPVQAAVVQDQYKGRDLLVSSQTGSGKTLAFGMLLAQGLLPEQAMPPRGQGTRPPVGLVIAPTRELANQVRTELAWLFAKTHLRIAAFTGGSDIVRDIKQLRTGADLVVGTPGRLVDLLKRECLRLDAVTTVVLDEADEMLDMGFQEDLEILLGAAAARTRTLMFSATLPSDILAMAARYQKEALRVDVRPEKGNAAHDDIEYIAHLTAVGDHLPAVINVLRTNGNGRSIVFGTTREGVASLHEELVRRGFSAVVLSGDRAQHERNRALAALRSGEARVLVATNVAARGLDLPEVDLVIHADLPLNTEDLTHRSGRTGRAGRKGRSVVIANLAERRKAERLMSNARVKFTWTEVPSAAAITQAEQATFEAALIEEVQAAGEGVPEARAVLARLCASVDREALLAALLKRELDRLPKGESLRSVHIKEAQGTPDRFPTDGPRRSHDEFARDAVVFRINLGAQSKAEPGWLLPLICRRGGVTRRDVGAIRVGQRASEFEIAGNAVQDFTLSASLVDPRAPHVRIERVSAEARSMARRPAEPARRAAEPARRAAEPAHPIAEPKRPRAAREHGGEERPVKVHRMPGRDHRLARPAHPAAPSFLNPVHDLRPSKVPPQKVQAHAGPGFKNPRPHAGNTGGLQPYRGRAQAHPGKKR
jgi:ATP-dependent RNA helicase DeaD